MSKYIRTNEKFVNPYYFIPLIDNCYKDNSFKSLSANHNLRTGYIDCIIETMTPVFIPNTTNNDVYEAKITENGKKTAINSYDFFSYEDLTGIPQYKTTDPVIPGSEIRGVIRSAYEALSNSCLSTLDKKLRLYKRVTNPANAGRLVLENGSWMLKPCVRVRLPFKRWGRGMPYFEHLRRDFQEGECVYYKKSRENARIDYVYEIRSEREFNEMRLSEVESKKYHRGYVHFGEHFGDSSVDRRNHESVFSYDKNRNDIEIQDKDALDLLIENIKLYRNEGINVFYKSGKKLHGGYNHINISNTAYPDKALVFYQTHLRYNPKTGEQEESYYFNPGQIGREMFYNDLHALAQSYAPCNSLDKLCSACKLFGFISSSEEGEALGSRIRFSDAKLIKENLPDPLFNDPEIIPELASPRVSATEFYLEDPRKKPQDQIALWNPDYGGNWEKIDRKDKIKSNPDYEPKIRGRKFYWHHEFNKNLFLKDNEASKLNTMIRPLNESARFAFKLYFNNITESELKQLIWSLELGRVLGKAHKIGKGKPLGLGSIKINISEVSERKVELGSSQLTYSITQTNQVLEQTRNVKNHSEILDLFSNVEGYKDKYYDAMNVFLHLTDFKFISDSRIKVIYPKNKPKKSAITPKEIKNDTATFNWFTANRQIKGTAFKPRIDQSLPSPANISNPYLIKYQDTEKIGKIVEKRGRLIFVDDEEHGKIGFTDRDIKPRREFNNLKVGDQVVYYTKRDRQNRFVATSVKRKRV